MLFVGALPNVTVTTLVDVRSISAYTVSKVVMSYNWTITSLVPKLCVTAPVAVIIAAKVDSPFKTAAACDLVVLLGTASPSIRVINISDDASAPNSEKSSVKAAVPPSEATAPSKPVPVVTSTVLY